MTAASLAFLEGRLFRAGSDFELIVFDRLSAEDRAALADLRSDPDFYGVLKPRNSSGRTIKSVNKDVALLFLTLQQPGPLPELYRLGLSGHGFAAQAALRRA